MGWTQFGGHAKPVDRHWLAHIRTKTRELWKVPPAAFSLPNHLEVGLPHVGADELDFGGEFFAQHHEESLESFYGSFLAHPEHPGGTSVDLIDQGEVFVALGILDFVHPDGGDPEIGG